MDPIKIVDKLTLRQEALRMAVEFISATKTGAGWQVLAESFESYLQGSADLPEYVDPNADKQQWVDMLNKMREEMKPNPWISVNSEMKPPYDTDIIGYENGSMYLCKLTKVYDEAVFFINDGCEFHPTHWMPIPPFAQPTL